MYEFSLDEGAPVAQLIGSRSKFNGEILHINEIKEKTKKPPKRKQKRRSHSESEEEYSRSESESHSDDEYSESKSESYSDDKSESYSDNKSESESDSEPVSEVTFKDCKLLPLPSENGRRVSYIAGKSGCGKTTYAATYLSSYRKMFPDRDIIVISRKPKDPPLDRLKPLRLVIDESIIEDPLDITQDIDGPCCILFDDAVNYPNKKVQDAVLRLMMDVMELGRSFDIEVVITSHLVNPNQKNLGRTIFNECHYITIFPFMGSLKSLRYMMENYLEFDKETIDKIFKLKSRWITIHNNAPSYVLHDHGAFFT